MAPAGTPPAFAKVWQELVKKTLARDDVRKHLQEWDIAPLASGPEETATRLARERKRWAEVVKRAHIRVD
ncbi:Tripartite tricarboxylate transporter family receptor [compost metagenome]